MRVAFACPIALILLGVFISGCQKSGETASRTDSGDSAPGATTVDVGETASDSSPANLAPVTLAADATPERVCEQFLKLLGDGELSDAERLLSRRSASVTRSAGLVLSAPSANSAGYEFDPPQYANTKQKLAMVMCRPRSGSGADETAMSWMLRRETEGWRITGLVLLEENEQPADLLSFENPADVEQIRGLLGGEPTVRQASGATAVQR